MPLQKFVPVTLLFLCLCFAADAQKVKYKDLFNLLNAKQYEQAEPFLKRYLRDNDDNPNAYLFMGLVYQDKSANTDVLTKAETMVSYLDSALFFYEKSAGMITEKEVKRNEEYYQAYSRRDLRTGKFGVKLSDVQFDIEKRREALKDKRVKVLTMKQHYVTAATTYDHAVKIFHGIKSRYADKREFFLKADEKLMAELKTLGEAYDSSLMAFSEYKTASQQLGKTGHNQMLSPMDINDFTKDGDEAADFLKEDLKVWDYKPWALNQLELIEKEVVPMRDKLLHHDAAINKLREKIRKDSVSVKSELSTVDHSELARTLKQFDPEPMPLRLFDMKRAELVYGSELALARHVRDSASLQLQFETIARKLKAVSELDSTASLLQQMNIEQASQFYAAFVTDAYGSVHVLKGLAESTHEFARREREKLRARAAQLEFAVRWLLDGQDTIPLTMPAQRPVRHVPLVVVKEKYTAGLVFRDSVAHGYLVQLDPAHHLLAKASFPVDSLNFKKRQLPVIKTLSAADATAGVIVLLYFSDERVEGKVPVTAVRFSKQKGLQWSKNALLDLPPVSIQYVHESDELQILCTGPDGSKVSAFDKNGKHLR